jgi:dipeptidyl aminopeptidase/acylaminoacyl peptidase
MRFDVGIPPMPRALCGLMLIVFAASGRAEEHSFDVRDSISMTTFSEPSGLTDGSSAQRSPDGKYFWLITSKGDIASNQIFSTLLLFDGADIERFFDSNGSNTAWTPKPRRLVSIEATPGITVQESYAPLITGVRWSPDSKKIFFLGQNSNAEKQLYEVDVKTGHSAVLTPPGFGVRELDIAGDVIAYTAIKSESAAARVPWNQSAGVNADAGAVTGLGLENILFPEQSYGFGNGKVVPDLWIGRDGHFRPVATPGTRQPIEDSEQYEGYSVLSLSPNGRFVVRLLPVTEVEKTWALYVSKPGFESWHIDPDDSVLTAPTNWYRLRQYKIIDTTTGRVSTPIDGPYGLSLAEEDQSLAVWAQDQKRLLLGNVALPLNGVDSDERARRRHTCAVAAVDLPSMNVSCVVFTRDASDVILPENPRPERLQNAIFGSDDDEVVLRFTWHGRWGQSERYRYDGGRWSLAEVLPGDPISGAPLDQASHHKSPGNNFSLTIKQGLNEPPVLWATSTHPQAEKPVWNPNPQFTDMTFGKATQYRWKDESGYEWAGILVTPPAYHPGQRYPLVIQTHGFRGYAFITDGIFPTAMAARPLASAGFVVLQMGWRIDHFDTGLEARDQVAGFQSAIAQLDAEGIIDAHRVGIIGFSRTCWHVEQALIDWPNLFAAATIADGIDLSYMQYGLFGEGRPSLRKSYEKIIGTNPDGNGLDIWMKQSPGFHLEKVVTPIRIEAIAPGSVLMEWDIYAALRRHNKPVDMIYIPDGQHILQKPLDRFASQQGNVDWFRFWLQGYERPNPEDPDQYKRWEHLRELRVADNKVAGKPSENMGVTK